MFFGFVALSGARSRCADNPVTIGTDAVIGAAVMAGLPGLSRGPTRLRSASRRGSPCSGWCVRKASEEIVVTGNGSSRKLEDSFTGASPAGTLPVSLELAKLFRQSMDGGRGVASGVAFRRAVVERRLGPFDGVSVFFAYCLAIIKYLSSFPVVA